MMASFFIVIQHVIHSRARCFATSSSLYGFVEARVVTFYVSPRLAPRRRFRASTVETRLANTRFNAYFGGLALSPAVYPVGITLEETLRLIKGPTLLRVTLTLKPPCGSKTSIDDGKFITDLGVDIPVHNFQIGVDVIAAARPR